MASLNIILGFLFIIYCMPISSFFIITHSNKVAKHTYTNTKLKYKNIRTKPKEDIYIYIYTHI